MPLPDDVSANELDADVRRDLQSLSKETSDTVARHLVMTGRLIDEDAEQALAHARAAGALAGRVAAVREAVGLAAYRAGEWSDALSELRAARRMSGSAEHLPVMADCERALGRPERALAAYDDPAVASLDQAVRVELVLVVAGARRDLGQQDAAVLLLQGPARATTAKRPWASRLWYGYADALLDAGRQDESRSWFVKAADVDEDGETDAAERVLELDGIVFDSDDDDEQQDVTDDEQAPEAALDPEGLRELVSGLAPLAGTAPSTETEVDALSSAPQETFEDGPAAERGDTGAATADSSQAAPGEPQLAEPNVASPFLGGTTTDPELPPPPRRAAVPGVAFVAAEPDDHDEVDR